MNIDQFILAILLAPLVALHAAGEPKPVMRPHIYLTAEAVPGLRSVADVKADIQSGHAKVLWEKLRQQADADIKVPVLVPTSVIAGRSAEHARHGNRDYGICRAVGQRVLRAAFASLITGDLACRDSALRQMEALFDPAKWPDWRDLSHMHLAADLRTGQLTHDLALAYDWLHPSLTPEQRRMIVEGIDRRGIRPFWKAIEEKAYWINRTNNWMTCIVGGLGIAGMALGDDHADSARLIEFSLPHMKDYLKIYGPDGEFNESPGYAGATFYPVAYFAAHRYWSRGSENLLAQRPFPQACQWLMHLTLPPGRCAAFGDTGADEAPKVFHVPAVAAATRDGILQWYYLHQPPDEPEMRELLWFDPRVAPVDPQGRVPLGAAFPAHGGCLVSRTDWNPVATPCVVYGKAGRERHHGDNDVGQLCVDGYGRRLIVDLGMPSMYPDDYWLEKRPQFYNASARGHNVLVFGGREMPGVGGAEPDTSRCGRIVASRFDPEKGASWSLDLTRAYDGVESVRRTVVHRLPGIVAVLDEASLTKPEEISLRWHTSDRCEPDAQGRFLVENGDVRLAARLIALDGSALKFTRREHAYQPPYDRNRLGEALAQRHESYVEVTDTAGGCRWLTLFAVLPPGTAPASWEMEGDRWTIRVGDDRFVVGADRGALSIRKGDEQQAWETTLPDR